MLGTIDQGNTPRSLGTLDYNRDGHADLVVYLFNESCLAVRLGDGAFDFGDATCVLNVSQEYVHTFKTFDYDGDGFEELVNYATGGIQILSPSENGFAETATIDATGAENKVVARRYDYDRDGIDDLLLCNNTRQVVEIFAQQGEKLCEVPYSVYGGSSYCPTTDFNHDGLLDFTHRAAPAAGPLYVHTSTPKAVCDAECQAPFVATASLTKASSAMMVMPSTEMAATKTVPPPRAAMVW